MKIKFTFPHVYQRRPNGACQYAYHWQEQLDPLPRPCYRQRHGLGRIWAKPGETLWAAIARRQRDGERARLLAGSSRALLGHKCSCA